MADASKDEINQALVFMKNFEKPGGGLEAATDGVKTSSSCNGNCDCYIELEITRAAGIAGYRYGS